MNVDYLHIGTALSGQCSDDLLVMLQESIKDERKGKLCRRILLQQDNTPVLINQVAMYAVC